MVLKKTILVLVVCLLFNFSLINIVQAGFGISPPYIKNENLTQGSIYKKKITLVRGDPIEDWKVEIITNVPGADDWISIDKGKEFIMPKGAQQVPMVFSVDVPKNAKFGRYTGTIRVKTTPVKPPESGTISILLGGQIDVNLNVQKEIFDFNVRGVKASDLEEGEKRWIFNFPGIIKFSMQIENLGNIKAAPSKVILDIYDEQKKELLETISTTKMNKINPFEIDWVIAELKTKLKTGSYYAQYKIFKKDEIVNQGEIHLSILAQGSIVDYKGATIFDLNVKDKLIIIFGSLLILFTLGFGIQQALSFLKRKR
jgi:hypothetical protein